MQARPRFSALLAASLKADARMRAWYDASLGYQQVQQTRLPKALPKVTPSPASSTIYHPGQGSDGPNLHKTESGFHEHTSRNEPGKHNTDIGRCATSQKGMAATNTSKYMGKAA